MGVFGSDVLANVRSNAREMCGKCAVTNSSTTRVTSVCATNAEMCGQMVFSFKDNFCGYPHHGCGKLNIHPMFHGKPNIIRIGVLMSLMCGDDQMHYPASFIASESDWWALLGALDTSFPPPLIPLHRKKIRHAKCSSIVQNFTTIIHEHHQTSSKHNRNINSTNTH